MTSNEKFIILIIVMEVGPLGFMCLDSDEAGGNMGLLDMVVALEVCCSTLSPSSSSSSSPSSSSSST